MKRMKCLERLRQGRDLGKSAENHEAYAALPFLNPLAPRKRGSFFPDARVSVVSHVDAFVFADAQLIIA
jgi:hypothetical protein